MTVEEIAGGLRGLLEEEGYKEVTIRFYEREWARIGEYIAEKYDDEGFDIGRGMAYLEDRYGIPSSYDRRELDRQRVQLLRVVHLLEDYRLHGVLTRRYFASRNPPALRGTHLEAFDGYASALGASDAAASTKATYASYARDFLHYLQQRAVAPGDVRLEDVEACERTLAGYTYKTVEQRVCAVRHLLRHLRDAGTLARDVASEVRMPPAPRAPHVPSAWDPEDLRAMLAAVDREGPLGKRDYAMLLLACVLGLRVSDIKSLRFGDFDWRAKRLRIVQRKTGRPLELPVPDVVGWAVIDYARGGRPAAAADDHVFLSHRPPYGPISDRNHLRRVLTRSMRRAGIRRDGRRCGFHSLRHTAGSMMLAGGVGLPVIAAVLGHADVDVTATYLKTDLERLADCALDPVPFPDEAEAEGSADADAGRADDEAARDE